MKKFDVERFNKNKGDFGSSYREGDFLIRQNKIDDCYVENISNNKDPYIEYTVYYLDTRTVQAKETRFYDMLIGIAVLYGKQGEVLKQVNYDLPYKFSLVDLAKKIKKEYNIDILVKNPKVQFVTRSENPYPHYHLELISEISTIIVSAENGDIITEVDYLGKEKEINKPEIY